LDAALKGGLKFEYQLFCNSASKPAAIGFTKHACVSKQGKVVRPPDFLIQLIKTQSRAESKT
jgi:acyl-CoA thioester hydrolase